MKPTVTINLAGVVYHIDNDAYETLNAYLKDIEAHLEDSDSKKEIMQDIEARIAELFSMHMKYSHIEVVNSTMVADIMTQLGSPEMISSGTEAIAKPAIVSLLKERTMTKKQQSSRNPIRNVSTAISTIRLSEVYVRDSESS